ncbi:MAG: UDP-glucose 4-epimerase GalE [Pyrinomonadaceae bacterium]|nr:UDP-glucose 4-epimerase GalE [Pyrinomonadaceae bacterium]
MRVLVTGGAGYIGSVVVEKLLEGDHEVVAYDNLVKGHRAAVSSGATFVEADLTDKERLAATLREHRIEAVIHMAADSLVGESVGDPAKYYRNNVVAGLALLDTMRECEVGRIVFSSTAAVYGEPEKQPIEEADALQPTNPYGESKLAFEKALKWYDHAYHLRYASLRYFNAAGATDAHGESHDPETHLIPLVLQAAVGQREFVEIYGTDYPTRDGTCVRDYIHVSDLAQAHILALGALDRGSRIYNLGCGGDGYTVREVIDVARKVTGREIPVRESARRAGDPAVLVAGSARIKRELGWSPARQDLGEIIGSAWTWMQKHQNGYER